MNKLEISPHPATLAGAMLQPSGWRAAPLVDIGVLRRRRESEIKYGLLFHQFRPESNH